jgi:hypothetical protein
MENHSNRYGFYPGVSMIIYDITVYHEYKTFITILESVVRSENYGYFKIGEDGTIAKITIEVVGK